MKIPYSTNGIDSTLPKYLFLGIFLILVLIYFLTAGPDGQGEKSRSILFPQIKPTTESDKTANNKYLSANDRFKWKFYTGGIIDSSPAIGSDGTIYFCCSQNSHSTLYALHPDGSKKWEFKTLGNDERSSPCIGENGTIYFGSPDGSFYAIGLDGSLRWKFDTEDSISSSPAIGLDGTIYFISRDGNLYALRPDGNLKWKFYIGGRPSYSPSIGPDGTIYLSASTENKLYALNPGGIKRWEFNTERRVLYSPAIDSDGTIYFSSRGGYFYALHQSGSLKWQLPLKMTVYGDAYVNLYTENPTIGPDRTIYIAIHHDSLRPYLFDLYALNPDGSNKWTFVPEDNILSSPAVGSDGTIYFGCYDGKLYALNSEGTLQWKFTTGGKINSSPAIASDGTIYFGSHDGYFYALNSDSQGLADSPWPKYHHDNQNTGSVQSSAYYAPFGELYKPDSLELYDEDEIEISGWALSSAGILKVEIHINDFFQGEAMLGIPRDDIYQQFPEYENRNSGFKWLWNTQSVPRGKYIIEAIAFNTLDMKASLGKREIIIFKW